VARYRIVPEQSVAWIDARSSVHPIHSRTEGLSGFFEAEVSPGGAVHVDAPLSGAVELPVDRLSSGNPLYDREMKRRVDSRRHPTISGVLGSMQSSGTEGSYRMSGEVTFRGVTCPVEGEMTITTPSERTLCLEGEHVFDVRRWGMDPPKLMLLKVYPDVTVRVRIVASRQADSDSDGAAPGPPGNR